MSKTLSQIFVLNPSSVVADNDLFYLVQSPYTIGTDSAILGSDLKSQFGSGTVNPGLTNQLAFYASSGSTVSGLTSAIKGVLVTSNSGTPSILAGPGTTGNILQSNAAAAPSFSTATYPSVATNAGRILRADGTNWVQSTSTFADTYTASSLLFANGANNVTSLVTANNGLLVTGNTGTPSILAGPGVTGRILQSNAANAPSFSTATYPSVGGASGNILISDGTNYIASTSLWPNTVGASGTIIRSNGTINAYSTSTFADIYAISTLLYASASNTISGLSSVNRASLSTNSTGVPTWLALTDGQIVIGSTAGSPAAASLTAGAGISITPGSNTITIANTGGTGTVTSISSATGITLTPNPITTTGTVGLTIPVAVTSGGTGLTSTTINQILYSSAANTIAGLATANNGVLVTSSGGVPSISSTLPQAVVTNLASPQPTVLTTGTGTYNTPVNTKYLIVEVQGGGGGGSGSGTGAGSGTAGNGSTFGSAFLTANGGTGGTANSNAAITGGTATGGDVNITGGGAAGGVLGIANTRGSDGGVSVFGGAANSTFGNISPSVASANTGAGGAGGGIGAVTTFSGSGGSAGGYCRKLVTSPLSSYAYAVGASAAGGGGGTSGVAGTAGASGIIIVTAYFQ